MKIFLTERRTVPTGEDIRIYAAGEHEVTKALGERMLNMFPGVCSKVTPPAPKKASKSSRGGRRG